MKKFSQIKVKTPNIENIKAGISPVKINIPAAKNNEIIIAGTIILCSFDSSPLILNS